MHKVLTRSALITLGLLLARPAVGADWYVDAANGSDSNGGTSWADAWQTVSHAEATAPHQAGEVIFIAPGVYDSALGEQFPITNTVGRSYVGVEGSDVTIIDAGGAAAPIIMPEVWNSYLNLTGLTLQAGQFGIRNYVPDYEYYTLNLTDVQITQTDLAVYCDLLGASLNMTLDRVVLRGNQQGMRVTNVDHNAGMDIQATDCVFSDNAAYGVRVRIAGPAAYADTFWYRCQFLRNGGTGMELAGDASWAVGVFAGVYDSLLAKNSAGVTDDWGYTRLEGCTIADNTRVGMLVGRNASSTLLGTILYDNRDDLIVQGGASASFCDIGDGDFAGTNNNFSADPLFLDPLNGDYRLTFGSPCVDTGEADLTESRPDLSGTPRDLDGDLDGETAVDVGALELAPLVLVGKATVGATMELELWGPMGGPSRVFGHRGQFADPPLSTPFGDLFLDRGRLFSLGSSLTAPGPPGVLFWNVPPDPSLVGQMLSVQAVSANGDPLQPWGLTNAIEVVFEQ